jgi:SAM-dependent methyltransferase
MRTGGAWETNAEDWARWAREPDLDAYWRFNRDAFFGLLPEPGGRALDLGCGEGRVARDLTARGDRVVGVDLSPTLVALAREADPGGEYVVADAAALPFEDATFDLVVAFNSLMNVDDMAAAVREAARVLTAEGRLVVCVTHPLNDAGTFTGDDPDAPFVIESSYFERRHLVDVREEAGLRFTFQGLTRPLEDYARALEDAGLLLEALREPAPEDAVAERWPAYRRWQRIPMFVHLRAVKRA